MVALAERVDAIGCAHALEAEVRELRLIAEHKPPYNRRSRFPERTVYLKLTDEPFPRLSQVRATRDEATYLGPFASARGAADAADAADALLAAVPLRQCTGRLSPRVHRPACALADLGRCGAPCGRPGGRRRLRPPRRRRPGCDHRRSGAGHRRVDPAHRPPGRRAALRGGGRPPRSDGGVRPRRRPRSATRRTDPRPAARRGGADRAGRLGPGRGSPRPTGFRDQRGPGSRPASLGRRRGRER